MVRYEGRKEVWRAILDLSIFYSFSFNWVIGRDKVCIGEGKGGRGKERRRRESTKRQNKIPRKGRDLVGGKLYLCLGLGSYLRIRKLIDRTFLVFRWTIQSFCGVCISLYRDFISKPFIRKSSIECMENTGDYLSLLVLRWIESRFIMQIQVFWDRWRWYGDWERWHW